MKKFNYAIIYGSIAGLLMITSWGLSQVLFKADYENFDFTRGEILGYVFMLLALTSVFIGIKNRRDKELNGHISFKDAFMTGFSIVLVTSVIYVTGWMLYYHLFMPDFTDKYLAYQLDQLRESGISAEEFQAQKEQLVAGMELYKKPHMMIAFTFLEIFPVGLIVALISAFILKKKK